MQGVGGERRYGSNDRVRPGIILVAWILASGIAIETASSAEAHATFVASEPDPNAILSSTPSSVQVTLSEAVQPGSVSIFVSNGTGVRFDTGPTVLNASALPTLSVALRPMGPGIYTVTWRAISADDGHFDAGSFNFAVTNPDGSLPGAFPLSGPTSEGSPVSPLEIALRFFAFFGLASVLGGVAFATLIWIPVLQPPGRALPEESGSAFTDGLRSLLTWSRLGALMFTVAVAGWWTLSAFSADGTGLSGVALSPFIISLSSRIVLGLAVFSTLSVTIARPNALNRPGTARATLGAIGGLAVAALGAGSIGTHATAALGAPGGIADAIHVLGASLWVGGLLAFVRVRPWLRSDPVIPHAENLLRRFSRLAFLSVGAVLGAGIVLGVFLVGSWEALIGTGYGSTVLAKVLLFAPMAALGAYNRYLLVPRPEKAERAVPLDEGEVLRNLPTRPASASSQIPLSAFERNVRAEAGLGAVILIVAGLLGALPPASSPSSAGPTVGIFTRQAVNGSLLVELSVFPFPTVPGRYVFDIQVWYETNHTGFIGQKNGTLNLTLLGTGTIVAVPFIWSGANHYFADTSVMDQTGTWQIDLPLASPGGSLAHFTFYVQLHG